MSGTEKIEYGLASYILGILSIVQGVLVPLSGLVIGIIGLVLSKKQKTEFSGKATKLNIIGIIVSIIFFIATIILTYVLKTYIGSTGLQDLGGLA